MLGCLVILFLACTILCVTYCPQQQAEEGAEGDADEIDPDVGKRGAAGGEQLKAFVEKRDGKA